MSARTDLVTALTDVLDPATYRVVGAPDVPDTIDVGTIAVRVYATTYEPGPTSGSVAISLTVWVVTPVASPGAADDVLDDARDDVHGALYALPWLTSPTAERDVMADTFAGWRFTCQAFGTIEGD